ncbi:zinc finger protein ZAT7-like [Corylus avellana]|uniref:zinc finger protein ZAT7-like n=1 Tax=Corylus avellana TaxID=13451 RepID=UPI00286A874A|nr:zinc finger protein ZAT7-like [Corylus avellana]
MGNKIKNRVKYKYNDRSRLRNRRNQRIQGKHRCEKCGKTFRSYQALKSHKTTCYRDEAGHGGNERIFECPFCNKVFGSGQALGDHKRSHLLASSPTVSGSDDIKLWKVTKPFATETKPAMAVMRESSNAHFATKCLALDKHLATIRDLISWLLHQLSVVLMISNQLAMLAGGGL